MFIRTKNEMTGEVVTATTKRVTLSTFRGDDMEIIQDQDGRLYIITADKELSIVPKSGNAIYIDLK